MSCYTTISDVKAHGIMPDPEVDQLEALFPGIVVKVATGISGHFDSRLQKRYAAPFTAPYPDAVIFAVVQVVVLRLYLKRGFDPESAQDSLIVKMHDDALAWLKEAADGDEGLVELPARQTSPTGATAVNAGGPLGYAEPSPYTFMDVQRRAVRGYV